MKMDAIAIFHFETIWQKTASLWKKYGEIPLHINNINGLNLYLSLDIGRYMILGGEMLQFSHKVSNS